MKQIINNADRIQLNRMARKSGHGRCTHVVINSAQKNDCIVDHRDYGFSTFSGKFFPGITTTKWFGSGYYSSARTTIHLSRKYANKYFPLLSAKLKSDKEIENPFAS